MEICKDLNFSKVILERDAQVIINAVNDGNQDFSYRGSIIEDIKKFCYDRTDWQVQFVYKDKNIVAHTLAKATLYLESKRVWIEEALDFVSSCLEKDKLSTG